MNPPRSEGFVRMPDAEFEAILTRAAEEGAKRALSDVGLDGDEAALDIRDLRSLVDCIRLVRRTAMQTAVRMITTGVMLAIARVIGETAPLLVTVGLTQSMNYSLTDGPMMTLPVFVYNSYMSQGVDAAAYVDRAWTGALTLILIVMALNLVARLIAAKFAPKGNR